MLIRATVTQNPTILVQFEQLLFPVFTPIFTDDVAGKSLLHQTNAVESFFSLQSSFRTFFKSSDFSWNRIRPVLHPCPMPIEFSFNPFSHRHFGIEVEIFPPSRVCSKPMSKKPAKRSCWRKSFVYLLEVLLVSSLRFLDDRLGHLSTPGLPIKSA